MYLKKYRMMIIVIAIGLVCALPAGVLAAATGWASALLAGDVTFQFGGQQKALPEGYNVLLYENHTYVPARFVAEGIGAEVVWEQPTKTVRINTKPCAECLMLYKEKQAMEETIVEQAEKIKALEKEVDDLKERTGKKEEEERAEGQPAGNYQRLPHSRVLTALNIRLTGLFKDDYYSRVYLELENKKTVPLQLQQIKTRAIVDGVTYKASDVLHFTPDQRWYHDIDFEELADGYIMLPPLPKDAKEMFLELTVLFNDAKQETTTIEFYIKLDS